MKRILSYQLSYDFTATVPTANTPTPAKAETPDIFKSPVTAGSETGTKPTKSLTVSTQAPPGTTTGTAGSETDTKQTKLPAGPYSAPPGMTQGPGGQRKSTVVPMKKEEGITKAPPVEGGPAGETKTTVEPLEVVTKTEGPGRGHCNAFHAEHR